MPLFGTVVGIKRSGVDGVSFPLTASSCLFGRRTECDIRIHLPHVSKEHCKIEVNENKEAVLTNLSTVNPTRLNGALFQHAVPLRHGDVFTIIDRSFRFEYPPQSALRKRRSRSPKDETLQVLHVQQVAEVELLPKEPSGSKSLDASDNGECEEKNTNEKKQSEEENVSKALPVQPQTPKSLRRVHLSIRKQNEKSPFSELYEKLKLEFKVKKSLQEGNVSQQATKEDGESVLPDPSAGISSSCARDLGSLTKEQEIDRNESCEECKNKIKQDVVSVDFNPISALGSATKKSFTRSPRALVSKEMSRDEDKRNNLQDGEEQGAADRSQGAAVTARASREAGGDAMFTLEQCSIVRLDFAGTMKMQSPATAVAKPAQTSSQTKVSEADGFSTPASKRRSPRSHSMLPTEGAGGMNPLDTLTPTRRPGVSLKRKSLSGVLAGTGREGSGSGDSGLQQLPLAENKASKQRRSSKQHTPGKPVQEAVLEEICHQANFNSNMGCLQTPASSNSKSPRRSNKQSKELLDKSVYSEVLASEELTSEVASPAGQKSGSGKKRGRPRTSGLLTEKASEADALQEHHEKTAEGKESGTEGELPKQDCQQKQDLRDASVLRPCRLSPQRRSSGHAAALKDSEAPASEINLSDLLAGEGSGKAKMISPKRRSGDFLPQPLGKRKKVSFGGQLSPELFDKSLPPNSPLKRGATPARLSLTFGHSPRAVLKKAQGLKHSTAQELSEHLQTEKMSPKHLQAQKSPVASSPTSGKTTPNKFTSGSPAPYRRGRFSVSYLMTSLPIAEEKEVGAEDTSTKEKSGGQVKTPKSSPVNQEQTFVTATPDPPRRSSQLALKVTPMRRRSGAVAVLSAKRSSGASSANLLVAKSWAEVVKSGVARPQPKAAKKRAQKRRSLKKTTQLLKTPERKIKGHFSTGHAESPATIVVGRAYSTTVRTAGQAPKVVKNPHLKLNMDMDESSMVMMEKFQTPENESGKTLSLATVQKADFTPTCTAEEISELHTPEEIGEMMVSPLNSSAASEQKQYSPGICLFLREEESPKSTFAAISSKTPEKRKAVLEENISVDTLSVIPEKQTPGVKSGSKRTPKQKFEPVDIMPDIKQLFRTPKRKSEPLEALSGIKQLMKTPKQKLEPVEDLSGIEQLMKTPKQKSEPVGALSGIKQLMKTPKQKLEPVEDLSGIKQLMKTPKQKSEPVEALSGIKQLMKTPKQKLEPVEDLSGIKQLMKTPKQKLEPVEDLSGIKQLMKTPKQKSEPVEALSGIKQLMKTPKQKLEPVEDLSGIKQLMKTPKQKLEPVEDLSGIKQLMKTPKQKFEPVEDLSGIEQLMKTPKQKLESSEDLSGIKQLMKTPKQKSEPAEDLSGIKELLRTPQQELEPVTDEVAFTRLLNAPAESREAAADVAGVNLIKRTPRLKYQPVEDMTGVSHIFKTPKAKVEPIENMFGFSRLVKTPKEKSQPVEDFVGLQRLMAEPRQKRSDSEVDYVGVTEMFDRAEEREVSSADVMDSMQEDPAPPSANSSHKCEDGGNTSQGEESQQKEATSEGQSTQRPTRGRPQRTVPPASAKQCEKGLNLKELQGLGKKSSQEEMGEICSSASVSVSEGEGRTKPCVQEEIVSELSDQEKMETLPFVQPHGARLRRGRGKSTVAKESKHPGENPQSCGKDSSVLRRELANMKQTLQEYGINDILETEDEPNIKAMRVPRRNQNENHQPETGLKKPENKPNKGVGGSEEKLLSPGKRTRGVKRVENMESLLPSRRGRRARNDQVTQPSSEGPPGTTRRLRKDPSAMQRDEETSEKDTEAARAGESEHGTTLKVTEERGKSLRSGRKHLPAVKAGVCGMALESTQTLQKSEETSTETQSHIKTEMKGSQGGDTENAQENTTEASRRLKAESPSGETNKMPVPALNLEASRSAVQETKRTRNRRGTKDSLEKKTDEIAKDRNNTELITPQIKSETKMGESSLTDSLGSVGVEDTDRVLKEQSNPAATSGPAPDSDSPARGRQKRTRSELKAKQTGILQGSEALKNRTACRRGTGKKVKFGEADSKVVEGKRSFPEDDKGTTCKDDQQDTAENPSSQVRRSRRKQVDSIPQRASSASVEKQTTAGQSKEEASVKEQEAALEAAASSTGDTPPRRGRRREVTAASQTSRAPSVRKRCGVPEGDGETMTVKEDQKPALGNKTLQVKASARDKGKKTGLAAEAKRSSPLQRKCDLAGTGEEEEGTTEEQNMPVETVPCAEEKPLGRGRRRETALASHTTNYVSLRGKRGLPANAGKEAASKEDQNVPLETSGSSGKENQLRSNRRKEIVHLLETSSIQGKRGLSKERGKKNSCREEKKQILENSPSQEEINLLKGDSEQRVTSLAVSSPLLQGLPEGCKNETQSAKENPSRASRKKTIPSQSEEDSSTSLREKSGLSRGRAQKRVLEEAEVNSSQEKRQLRNKRRKVEFTSEAATCTSLSENLTEEGDSSETQNVCLASTGSEKNHQPGKGKGGTSVRQAAATSRRRRCQLPADGFTPKKLKSGSDENGSLSKGKRNKTKEELVEEDSRTAQAAGGTGRKTRSSARTRK